MQIEQLNNKHKNTDTIFQPAWVRMLVYAVSFAWIISILLFLFLRAYGSDTQRHITVAFAVFLAIFLHQSKLFKQSNGKLIDLIFAMLAASCALYPWLFESSLNERAGLPTSIDIIAAGLGLTLFLMAIWRTFNSIVVLILLTFIFYAFWGWLDWIPETIQWKGASVSRILWHYWLQTEGVFGLNLAKLFPLITFWMVCSLGYFFINKKCRWALFGSRKAAVNLLAVFAFVGLFYFFNIGLISDIELGMLYAFGIFSYLVYLLIKRNRQKHLMDVFENWLIFIGLTISPIVQWILFAAMLGLVVGTISLTGMDFKIAELIEMFGTSNSTLSSKVVLVFLAIFIGWMLWVLFCNANKKIVIDGEETNNIGFAFVIAQLVHILF